MDTILPSFKKNQVMEQKKQNTSLPEMSHPSIGTLQRTRSSRRSPTTVMGDASDSPTSRQSEKDTRKHVSRNGLIRMSDSSTPSIFLKQRSTCLRIERRVDWSNYSALERNRVEFEQVERWRCVMSRVRTFSTRKLYTDEFQSVSSAERLSSSSRRLSINKTHKEASRNWPKTPLTHPPPKKEIVVSPTDKFSN